LSVDARRARLWERLGLGPIWSRRQSVPGQSEAAGPDEPTATPAPAGDAVAAMDWDELERAVAGCTACGLCKTRTRTVFGVGHRTAQWMVIGEGPGAEEDLRGEPFVGQAGRLLDSILSAAGLGRAASGRAGVYIANVVKCRPPGNRDPSASEAAECLPYLEQQIALLNPRIMLAVGRIAAQNLLRTDAPLTRLRRQVHAFGPSRLPLVVTYHPAYLLRTPTEKRKAWEDLKFAREVCARVER